MSWERVIWGDGVIYGRDSVIIFDMGDCGGVLGLIVFYIGEGVYKRGGISGWLYWIGVEFRWVIRESVRVRGLWLD